MTVIRRALRYVFDDERVERNTIHIGDRRCELGVDVERVPAVAFKEGIAVVIQVIHIEGGGQGAHIAIAARHFGFGLRVQKIRHGDGGKDAMIATTMSSSINVKPESADFRNMCMFLPQQIFYNNG